MSALPWFMVPMRDLRTIGASPKSGPTPAHWDVPPSAAGAAAGLVSSPGDYRSADIPVGLGHKTPLADKNIGAPLVRKPWLVGMPAPPTRGWNGRGPVRAPGLQQTPPPVGRVS